MLMACVSTPELRCAGGEQLAIHDSLYFGTAKPAGIITPQEWTDFLQSTVTPRFPQGLTESDASGQWRGSDGVIVREKAHVLQIVHADDVPSENAIREVVGTYKK